MRSVNFTLFWFFVAPALTAAQTDNGLGLPPVPVPATNPQSEAKIALGDRLFHETRFSSTGAVSCSTCHDAKKAFTDSPLATSEGIHKLRGTRNAPTVINAAYNATQFWDGRSPDLEDQAQHPFVNPLEMGLPDHAPILKLVRSDPEYANAFKQVFGIEPAQISMQQVTQAIAAFERTIVAGNSPFDRWYFGGDKSAMNGSAVRGFQLFLREGRCVSCHSLEQDHALFSDRHFHNVGVGINEIQEKMPTLTQAFLQAKAKGADVDKTVLADKDVSHLGRGAVDDQLSSLGAFKTPTLRNIALTAPYMHDGSLATLRDVVVHYTNGGVSQVAQEGRRLWTSPELGSNGVVCAQCHPNGANTHPETYPKFQKQLGKVTEIWEMINWCIRNPLEGKDLAADAPGMIAIQAYLAKERRGVPLAPGKH